MSPHRALLLLALVCGGCFGAGPAPRYYDPTPLDEAGAGDAPPGAPAALPPVRLRKVEGVGFLGPRVAWRGSDVLVGVYEEERWTEPPATYVAQALGRELYERRRLRRGGRSAPYALEVEVRAFEEVLVPEHEVRVELWLLLVDQDEAAVLERTVVTRRRVGEDDAAAMARAMAQALRAAVAEVADSTQRALEERARLAAEER